MNAVFAEQDEIAAAIEGQRQAEMSLHSLMLYLASPDALFDLLRPAFEEGAPYSRARAIARRMQKQLEATL